MKKIIMGIAAVLLLALTSCSFETPKKVTVKTKASYNFSIGDIAYSYDLRAKIGESIKDYDVYDYYPDGSDKDVQQFLLNLPIKDIPVDIGSALEKTDLTTLLSDMSIDQKIKVPDAIANASEGNKVDLSDLNKSLNAAIKFTGSATISGTSVELGVSGVFEFDSISYTSGNLLISVFGIKDGEKVTVQFNNSTSARGTFYNGVAEVPLSGNTIYSTGMVVKFTSGFGKTFTGSISEDAQINVATNLTVAKDDPNAPAVAVKIDEIVVPNSSSASYKTCTIGEGDFTVGMNVDSDWKNVVLLLKVESTGGLVIDNDNYSDAIAKNKVVDLKGKNIEPLDIKVAPKVDITLKNSTVSFSKEPTVDVTTTISKFAAITAKIENAGNFGADQNVPLGDDFLDFIKEIDFEESGFKLEYINNLPVGNDITISSTCNFFGITDTTPVVLKGGTEKITEASLTSKNKVVKIGKEEGECSSINFTASLSLPGATAAEPDVISLNNVSSGTEYTIRINIVPVIDWNSIKIKKLKQQSNTKLNLNFAEIFSVLGDLGADSISIPELPMYLYITRPSNSEALKNAKFSCKEFEIKYGIENETTGKVDYLTELVPINFLSGDEAQDLKFVEPIDLKISSEEEDKMKTVTRDLKYTEFSLKGDLANLTKFSEGAEIDEDADDTTASPYLCYDLELSDGSDSEYFEITNPKKGKTEEELAAQGEQTSSISITAMIVLPLKLESAKDMNLDLLELAGISSDGGDVLGRTEATDPEEIEDYMALLESAYLNYKFNVLPFRANGLTLNIDMGAGEKSLSFEQGQIGVNRDTIKHMLTTVPYSPKVNLNIPEHTVFSIPRDFGVDVHLSISINTNGSITIFEKGENE